MLAIAGATYLAVLIYAYRSWAGFLSLTAIAVVLVVGALLIATIAARLSRQPIRFDLAFAVTAIGVVVLSWNEIRATGDANRLIASLEALEDEGVVAAVAASDTDAGAFIAAIMARRGEAVERLTPIFADLWDETILTIAAGPDAEDEARLGEAMAIADDFLARLEPARLAVDAGFDELLDTLAGIETSLPESKRESVLVTAQRQIIAMQNAFAEALALAGERLEAGRRAASILSTFPLNYRYNRAEDVVELDQEGARIAETTRQYHRSVDIVRSSGLEIDAVLARYASFGAAEIRELAEAAAVPP